MKVSKTVAFDKCVKVIESCETKGQLVLTEKWIYNIWVDKRGSLYCDYTDHLLDLCLDKFEEIQNESR